MTFARRAPLGLKDRSLPPRFSAAERAYFGWLHRLPCCLSGRTDIHIAHTGTLEHGKGMGRKAALWTCLPLAQPLHMAEESNRAAFWAGAGLDPIPYAQRLWDIYQTTQSIDDARALILSMQRIARVSFLIPILSKVR